LYQRLAHHPFRDQLPWAQTHFFWGDERSVPPTDPESNFHQAQVALFDHIAIPANNVHRIKGEWEPRMAADDYAAQLCQLASPNLAWPRFDLILLGLGRDGHTASLFPGPINSSDQCQSPVLAVMANYQGRPAQRVTLAPLVLNSARHIFFLVAGADKAEALTASVTGPLEPERWPAQRIQLEQGTLTWFVDEAAASALPAVLC
jgi:6-phosphogluconolactonase